MSKVTYRQNTLVNVDKCITDAHESWQSTQKKIQIAVVSVIMHIKEHGDYRKANTLVNGLKGINQAGVVEAFVMQGGQVSEEEKGFSAWDVSKIDIKTAKATMWWDLKPQNPWKGYNLKDALLKVVSDSSKASKRVFKDADLADVVDIDEELLQGLKDLLAA